MFFLVKKSINGIIIHWLLVTISVWSCFKAYLGSNDNHKVKPLDCYAVRLRGLWSVTTCKNVLLYRAILTLNYLNLCHCGWHYYSMLHWKSFVFFLIFCRANLKFWCYQDSVRSNSQAIYNHRNRLLGPFGNCNHSECIFL